MDSTQQTNTKAAAQKPDKKPIWQLFALWVSTRWAAFRDMVERATQRTPKQGQTKLVTPEEQFYLDNGITPEKSAGFADKVEGGFVNVSSGLSLIFFTLILGYGNGFILSGFHEFQLAGWVGIMYLGGFLLETVGTSSLIIARRSFKHHKVRFAWGVAGFVGLALISATTQYYMYKAQIARGVIDLPVNSLNVPVFSFLLGDSTTEWFIWARAFAFHGAIVIATFLITTRNVDIKATVAKVIELANNQAEIDRAKQQAKQASIVNDGFLELWKDYNEGFRRKMQTWVSGGDNVVDSTIAAAPMQQPRIEYRDKIVERMIVPPRGFLVDHDGNYVKAEAIQPMPDIQVKHTIPTIIPMPTQPVVQEKEPVEPRPIELHTPTQNAQISTTVPNNGHVKEEQSSAVLQQPSLMVVSTGEDEDDESPLV